jgi:hypothetical protein
MQLIKWVQKLVGNIIQPKQKRRGINITTINIFTEAQLN